MPPLEFQLLVQAVRTAPPDPSPTLHTDVDWPKLVELAVYHGVEKPFIALGRRAATPQPLARPA